MKKMIKIFVYLVLAVVIVMALAIGGIVMFVNPNQFKSQITELVEKNANVVLTIDGDIEWTFYPWLGIKVQNVLVASPSAPTVPIVNVKLAQASILLKSIFNRELYMNDVAIEGLSVSLLKDANGNTNWALPDQSQTKEMTIESGNSGQADSKANVVPNLYVKSIHIKDANLIYKDAQKNQALALKNFNVMTGEVTLDQPISIAFNSDYLLFDPKTEGHIDGSTIIAFNPAQKYLQMRDLKLKNDLNMDKIQLLTELSTRLDIDFTTQLLQLSDLSAHSRGHVQDFAVNDLYVQSLVKADLKKEFLNVDQLKVSMGDLAISGDVIAENYSNDGLKFTGQISTSVFDLQALFNQLKIKLPQFESPTVLQKVSIQLSANGNLKNIDVNSIEVVLDETKVKGSVAIALGKVPTIAVALKGDQLVLNHYLPPKKKTVNTSQQIVHAHPNTKEPMNPEIVPILPKNINVIADLQWDQLMVDQLHLVNSRVKGSLKNGDAVFEQVSTNIDDGHLSFNGSLKGQKSPKIILNGKIHKINLTKVLPQISLKDYIQSDFLLSRLNQNHKNINVEGVLNAEFGLITAGRLQNQLIANLNGDANFDLVHGRVNNLNYEQLMCQGITLLNQKTLTGSFDRNYTDFQKLSGKMRIKNGVITNDSLQMLVPGFAINGKGDVNLNRMAIDYRMNAVLTGDHSIHPDPACQINERFKVIAIPLVCEGSLEKSERLCRLDTAQLSHMIAGLAENAIKEKANKVLDLQKDKLQRELDRKIEKQLKNPAVKGLLKNLL